MSTHTYPIRTAATLEHDRVRDSVQTRIDVSGARDADEHAISGVSFRLELDRPQAPLEQVERRDAVMQAAPRRRQGLVTRVGLHGRALFASQPPRSRHLGTSAADRRTRSVTGTPEEGAWTLVVMNGEGTTPVDADVAVGATAPVLDDAGPVPDDRGLLAGGLAAILLYAAVPRRTTTREG